MDFNQSGLVFCLLSCHRRLLQNGMRDTKSILRTTGLYKTCLYYEDKFIYSANRNVEAERSNVVHPLFFRIVSPIFF